MDLDLTLLLFPVYNQKLLLPPGYNQKYCNPSLIIVIYPDAANKKGKIFMDGQTVNIFKKDIAYKLEKIWKMTLHDSASFNC
jgi:hypothetical protein